jgi:hypothetical protein
MILRKSDVSILMLMINNRKVEFCVGLQKLEYRKESIEEAKRKGA